MAVRIRLKRMGRRHRPFFRICAMDSRTPRDGKVIEELGYYDPMVRDTDARAVLNKERIDYWLSVGAQPTEKVKTLIKKYGSQGTHLEAQQKALERLRQQREARRPARPAAAAADQPQPASDKQPEEAAAAEPAAAGEAEQSTGEGDEQ